MSTRRLRVKNNPMATRRQNEREYKYWEELSGGGRRYWSDRRGFISGFQRVIKIVDENEVTIQVIQEIYDDVGELIEHHQKYPHDTGHQTIL